MTASEITNLLRSTEQRHKRELRELKEKQEKERKQLLDNWAKTSGRFKVGDIIIHRHPNYGPVGFDIIRVESVFAVCDSDGPCIVYRGRELNSDFTEQYSVSGYPRDETIYDVGGNTPSIDKLDKPLFVSFVVVTSGGKEYAEKTEKNSLDRSKSILTTTYDGIVRYGVTESGERIAIQTISNCRQQFEKAKLA